MSTHTPPMPPVVPMPPPGIYWVKSALLCRDYQSDPWSYFWEISGWFVARVEKCDSFYYEIIASDEIFRWISENKREFITELGPKIEPPVTD